MQLRNKIHRQLWILILCFPTIVTFEPKIFEIMINLINCKIVWLLRMNECRLEAYIVQGFAYMYDLSS